jgi:hypothetical protein
MKPGIFNQACACRLASDHWQPFPPESCAEPAAGQDQLVEIYDRDLQFTLEETKTILAARLRYPQQPACTAATVRDRGLDCRDEDRFIVRRIAA